MTIIIYVLNLFLILISPILCFLIGENALYFLRGKFGLTRQDVEGEATLTEPDFPWGACSMALGLVLYCNIVFVLAAAALPWAVCSYLPLLLGLIRPQAISDLYTKDRLKPGLNFFLWFIFILGTGCTLFRATEGIQTPWKNNYGDLTFHLGMITSFVFGNNIPPEYHLMAGQRLSYPFYMNLWSSALWWATPDFKTLSIIFAVQWVTLWCTVFYLLAGNFYRLLPWALLLGGGSYFVLGKNSGELIGENQPWTSFVTTIWVPQRTALFGACVCLAAVRLFMLARAERKRLGTSKDVAARRTMRFTLLSSGLLLGLAPLVHTHFFMVTVLFIGLVSAFDFLVSKFQYAQIEDAFRFLAPLCLSVFFLPWILAKAPWSTATVQGAEGMGKIITGWVTGPKMNGPWQDVLTASLNMWFHSAPFWFLALLVLWLITMEHAMVLSIAALFVVFNIIQLAFWEWDQIKIFLALYFISFAVWARSRPEGAQRYVLQALQVLCIALSIPSIMESDDVRSVLKPYTSPKIIDAPQAEVFSGIIKNPPFHTVYSKEDVNNAEKIRRATPANAVIQGNPNHNSLITLTGRKLFMGYEGTLSSHGLKYQTRKEISTNLGKIAHCKNEYANDPSIAPYCPQYITWTGEDIKYWPAQSPAVEFELVEPGVLYKVK